MKNVAQNTESLIVWTGFVVFSRHIVSHLNRKTFAPFAPLRQWLNQIEIHNSQFAHTLCQNIPAQCPFERELNLFNRVLLRIPPLCKLNPFYNEIVSLRFRAICYLADECGEDISQYC